MKLNKFKVFSIIGLGLATISAVGTYAGYASVVVESDPRIYTAAKTADVSLQLLDMGGNYLWNSEIEKQSNDLLERYVNVDLNETTDDFLEVDCQDLEAFRESIYGPDKK